MHQLSPVKTLSLMAVLVLISFMVTGAERNLRKSMGGRQSVDEAIEIDASAQTHPFPHFWEKTFG